MCSQAFTHATSLAVARHAPQPAHPRLRASRRPPSRSSCPAALASQVDIGKHVVTATGADFYKINDKGNVPCLVLADGTVLNEGAAVLQWIADASPEAKLAPANGTTERYILQNVLNCES